VDLNNPLFLPIAFGTFFIAAIGFSSVINGLLLRFSKSLGARGDQHRHIIRWSSSLKPSLGGFSFYILFLISITAYGFLNFFTDDYLNLSLLGVVLAVNVGFLLGLTDDAFNTIPLLKLFAQLLCGVFLVITGSIIPATGIYAIDVTFTLVWVVGIMNSINLLDNMDGISATVSLFLIAAVLLVLGIQDSFYTVESLMLLGVSGALIGFLIHNIHPAKIYMGDTGSQFLGAFISAVSIQVLWQFHEPIGSIFQLKQFLIPLIAFSVPLIDTTTVIIHRIARGQSPFVGGKDHITHHFVYAGLNDKQVMYVLTLWTAVSAILSASLVYLYDELTMTTVIGGYTYLFCTFLITQYFYEVGKRKEKKQAKSKSMRPTAVTSHQSVTA